MDHPPAAPGPRLACTRIERDNYLVRQLPAPGTSSFHVNSMVIVGREPVIVDTGTSTDGTQWLDDVFALVDPGDVR